MAEPSPLKRLVNSIRTPGGWVISALERAQESSGAGRHDPGYFHPSNFGNDCDAFLAFRYLGAPAEENISARTRRIFDLGSGRDTYLKQDMRNAGISLIKMVCESEYEAGFYTEGDRGILIPHLHIRGELDDWIYNPQNKEKFVIDFKTMNSVQWEALTAVVHSHHLQVLCYEYGKETYKGFVLYENKNNQELKIFSADFDGRMWQTEIVERVNRIIEGLDINLVYRNPTSCGRCPFFKNGVCTSNQIAKLKKESGLYD